MTIVAAFLVPGSPLPTLRPDNAPWAALVAGYKKAGRALAASKPDVLLIYSTQWIAVLDELWQTRARVAGVHVDENWYDYGDLPYDIPVDRALAEACVEGCRAIGIAAKGVDYDDFPIDSGTIVASGFLNAGAKVPIVIGANNLYHDFPTTAKIAAMAAQKIAAQNKRAAVIGIGGLSGTIFRNEIDLAADHVASEADDAWNRRMLGLFEKGSASEAERLSADYAKAARVDMGFKHFAWIMGALGGRFKGAEVHGYGPTYGAGAAVVEFKL